MSKVQGKWTIVKTQDGIETLAFVPYENQNHSSPIEICDYADYTHLELQNQFTKANLEAAITKNDQLYKNSNKIIEELKEQNKLGLSVSLSFALMFAVLLLAICIK
jgi:hypothetical protein